LERRARFSPAYLQAYIRAAEIVGADLERLGQPKEALLLYQRILALRETAPAIAVRAVKLAWRSGKLKEAAAMSSAALETDNNLSAGRALHGALNHRLSGL
jgi:tetratricopeptide (TPR) repeat protein